MKNFRQKQTGTVLVIALIMLASLTMISMSSVDSAVMGLRISRNVEAQSNAFQTSQSAVDQVMSDTNNLPMTGPLFQTASVTLTGNPFVADTVAGETITADAERTTDCGMPPRVAGPGGTSMLAYSAFSFRIGSDVDRTSTGRGYSSLRQGYMVLGPKC